MRRRDFLGVLGGGAAATWPVVARAQQPERMRRIGVLLPAAADDAEFQIRLAAFHQGLALLGWTIGRNVHIDTRWATTDAAEIRRHAAELAALANDNERGHRLCELNVVDQVRNVCESTIVLNAWKEGRGLLVHGWVYGLQDGLLRDLLETPVGSVKDSLKL